MASFPRVEGIAESSNKDYKNNDVYK